MRVKDTMTNASVIRDFVYLDLGKLESLFSQVRGGLVEALETSVESDNHVSGSFGASIGLLKGSVSGESEEKIFSVERKTLHHHIERLVEDFLEQLGLLFDLDSDSVSEDTDLDMLRNEIAEKGYIRATGRILFEDFGRLGTLAESYPRLVEIVGTLGNLDQPEMSQLLTELDEVERGIEIASNSNEQKKLELKVRVTRQKIRELAEQFIGESIPDVMLDGIRDFIRLLASDRLACRLMPSDLAPKFQIVANLKRDCFVDLNFEQFLASYGREPNVDISVFGTVTSVAPANKSKSPFEAAVDSEALPTDTVKSLADSFSSFLFATDGLAQLVQIGSYPSVIVHPIAIYREICNAE